MNIFCWNCRGARNGKFIRIIKEFICQYYLDICVIDEPRINVSRADSICRRFVDFTVVRVEAQGFASGIWMWWRSSSIQFTVMESHDQALFCKVLSENKEWLLTAIYGSP